MKKDCLRFACNCFLYSDKDTADTEFSLCLSQYRMIHSIQNELDLGKEFVFEFVQRNLPKKMNLVNNMFQHPGAYSNYKALLESENILQTWCDFENAHEEKALPQWYQDDEIKFED